MDPSSPLLLSEEQKSNQESLRSTNHVNNFMESSRSLFNFYDIKFVGVSAKDRMSIVDPIMRINQLYDWWEQKIEKFKNLKTFKDSITGLNLCYVENMITKDSITNQDIIYTGIITQNNNEK